MRGDTGSTTRHLLWTAAAAPQGAGRIGGTYSAARAAVLGIRLKTRADAVAGVADVQGDDLPATGRAAALSTAARLIVGAGLAAGAAVVIVVLGIDALSAASGLAARTGDTPAVGAATRTDVAANATVVRIRFHDSTSAIADRLALTAGAVSADAPCAGGAFPAARAAVLGIVLKTRADAVAGVAVQGGDLPFDHLAGALPTAAHLITRADVAAGAAIALVVRDRDAFSAAVPLPARAADTTPVETADRTGMSTRAAVGRIRLQGDTGAIAGRLAGSAGTSAAFAQPVHPTVFAARAAVLGIVLELHANAVARAAVEVAGSRQAAALPSDA